MQKAPQCDLSFNRFPLWLGPDTGGLSYSQKRSLKGNEVCAKLMEKKQKGLPSISSPVFRKTIISLYSSDSLKNMIPLLNCELKKNPEEIRRECVVGSLKGLKISRKGDFDLEFGLLSNETESIELLSESLSTKLTKSVSLASHNLLDQHLPQKKRKTVSLFKGRELAAQNVKIKGSVLTQQCQKGEELKRKEIGFQRLKQGRPSKFVARQKLVEDLYSRERAQIRLVLSLSNNSCDTIARKSMEIKKYVKFPEKQMRS